MPDGLSQEESITGEIIQLSDRFWSGGWGHGKLLRSQGRQRQEVKISGILEGQRIGTRVTCMGKWANDKKYGPQFSVTAVVRELPDSNNGVIDWLVLSLPQIGPVRARALVNRFPPPQLWDVIERTPERLMEIEGITEERVQQIAREYLSVKQSKECLIELYDYGLNQEEATSALSKMGYAHVVDLVNEDPYQLYWYGVVSFNRADAIANDKGLTDRDPRRDRAELTDVLVREAMENGHTATSIESVKEHFCREKMWSEDRLDEALMWCAAFNKIDIYDGEIQPWHMCRAEESICLDLLGTPEERSAPRDQELEDV